MKATNTIQMWDQVLLNWVESSIILSLGIAPQPVMANGFGVVPIVITIRRVPAIIPIMNSAVSNAMKNTSILTNRQ
jgi:hypothetical protein